MNMLSLALRFIAVVGAVAAIALFFTIRGQLGEQRERADTLSQQRTQLDTELSDARTTISSRETRIESLSGDVRQRDEQIAALNRQFQDATTQRRELTTQFETASREAETVRQQLSDLRRELVEARARIPSTVIDPARVEELETTIANLRSQVSELETTNSELKTRVAAAPEAAAEAPAEGVTTTERRARTAPANLTGNVLSVSDNGTMVALSFGAQNGARENMRVRIISGSTLLGELTLTNVQNDFSVGQVLSGVGSPKRIAKDQEVLILVL